MKTLNELKTTVKNETNLNAGSAINQYNTLKSSSVSTTEIVAKYYETTLNLEKISNPIAKFKEGLIVLKEGLKPSAILEETDSFYDITEIDGLTLLNEYGILGFYTVKVDYYGILKLSDKGMSLFTDDDNNLFLLTLNGTSHKIEQIS